MSGELIFLIGVILMKILFCIFIHIFDMKQLKEDSKRLDEIDTKNLELIQKINKIQKN